jgi:hypothetical protein
MELLRKLILRVMIVVGFPLAYGIWWLCGGVHWQDEFWTAARAIWRADRR